MDDSRLQRNAREAIQSGALPDEPPERTWGGPGAGARCALCDGVLSKEDVELEIEFAARGENGDRPTFHMHPRCFAAWEAERRRMESSGEGAR